MSTDKLDSIAVLAPVEMNDSSLKLVPGDKVEQKELAPPIFHSIDADFYNFNFFNNTVGGNDYSLDTFLSLPFTADEVMEEGGGLSFHAAEDEDDGLSESNAINFEKEIEIGLGNDDVLSPEPDSNNIPLNDTGKVAIKKKVYQCQECDSWFVRASRFHEHVMSHKNVRPFRCSVCPYQTKWKSDVKKHIKKQISKGDQTHVNGRMIVSNDYEKDKLKGYNIFYVEKMIHCIDGTNKVPETGTSRNCVRDPSDPEPPPLPIQLTVPRVNRSNNSNNSSINNGKNKKKKSEGGNKKIKLENNSSSPTKANDPNEIPQGQQQSVKISSNHLPNTSLQNLLGFGLGLGQAQLTSSSDSEPIFVHRTLPIPVQEFTHLVGFNKY